MQDPKPANISGKKVRQHTFSHTIRWDYLALALLGLYLAWKFLGSSSSESEEEGAPIDVEAVGDAGRDLLAR